MEKELRKQPVLCGTELLLGNGEFWCFSALPLGKKRVTILGKLTHLAKKQTELGEAPENDQAAQLKAADELFEAGAELAFAVLTQNYPGLTREKFDELELVTSQHINPISTIVRGETEIGERIGAVFSGEAIPAGKKRE